MSRLTIAPPITGAVRLAASPRTREVPVWLAITIGCAIAMGIFFRFYHIDHKVFWGDEIVTSLRVLGLTEAEIVSRAPALTNVGELQTILHPGANGHRGVGATIHSLVAEDPHHSPLYYIVATLWIERFGDSIAMFRMLSAVLGVLALPCMFWLCRELFASKRAAWLGTAAFAVAPVAVLYAQEAREYALWTIAILVMGASFLRATRRRTAADWALYALCFAFGLYVYPFSGVLALGNLALLGVSAAFPRTRDRVFAIAASAVAVVLFTPWLVVIERGMHQIDRSMHVVVETRHSVAYTLHAFLKLFPVDVLDLNLFNKTLINTSILIATLALVGYSLLITLRSADKRIPVFIFAMIVAAAAPFLLPDLLGTGNRTSNPRYFTPMYVALDLSFVYLFASRMSGGERAGKSASVWTAVFVGLLAARVVSCAVSSQYHTWWNKFNEQLVEVAAAVNASTHPVLVSDNYIEYPLSLSNYLRPDVGLALRPRCYQCSVGDLGEPDMAALTRNGAARDVFLVGPSATLHDTTDRTMRRASTEQNEHCIDVRGECPTTLHIW